MFVSLLDDVLNGHIPWREKRVKRLKQPDWMSEDILKAISTRDKLDRVQDNENYKIWHNKVLQMIRKSKRDYYISIIEQCVSDSSKFLQYLRELDPKSTVPPPPKLKEGEEDITDHLEIATCFNTFFSNITENYLSDDNRPAPRYDKLKAFVDSKIPPDAVFDFPAIENVFALKELQNVDPKKADGTDGLS